MSGMVQVTPFIFYNPLENYAVADIREGQAEYAQPQEGEFYCEYSIKNKPLRVSFNEQTELELLKQFILINFPGINNIDEGGIFIDIDDMHQALSKVSDGDFEALTKEIENDPARAYTKQ